MPDTSSPAEAGYILVVEDDAAIGDLLQAVISDAGSPVRVVRTGNQALQAVADSRPAVVVLDLGLPGLYGTTVALMLRQKWRDLPIVVTSAAPEHTVSQDAWRIGAAAYFTKPFDCWELVDKIQRLVAAQRKPQPVPRPPDPSTIGPLEGPRNAASSQRIA